MCTHLIQQGCNFKDGKTKTKGGESLNFGLRLGKSEGPERSNDGNFRKMISARDRNQNTKQKIFSHVSHGKSSHNAKRHKAANDAVPLNSKPLVRGGLFWTSHHLTSFGCQFINMSTISEGLC